MGGGGAGDRRRGGGAGADPAAAADLNDLDGDTDGDEAWLPAVGKALGGPARVVHRAVLTGGYVPGSVQRVDLDVGGCPVTVVLKAASPVEVAAMRAVAVVGGVPRALAAGNGWLVLPFVDAPPLPDGAPVPAAVWDTLARVHAHWWRKRPRGLPVVDGPWWAALCDRTLVAVRGGLARTGDPRFADAAGALERWRSDPRILRALATLPRTLCHGDPHRGNVLGETLIDWGNARVAPAGLDLAVLRAQGAVVQARYGELFAQLTGGARAPEHERPWADAHAHVQYLGFAADHLGAERVAQMVEVATSALDALGPRPRCPNGTFRR